MRSYTYISYLRACPYRSDYRNPVATSLPGICTANHQIYNEMDELIKRSRPIQLNIVDDLFFNNSAGAIGLRQLVQSHGWIWNNTKEVRLQFTFSGWGLQDYDKDFRQSDDYWPPRIKRAYPTETQIKRSNFWRSLFCFCCCTRVRAQPRNSLKAMALFLSTFPKLQNIELMFDHIDMAKTWTDFWGDLNALAATGAKCSFVVPRKGQVFWLYHLTRIHGGRVISGSTHRETILWNNFATNSAPWWGIDLPYEISFALPIIFSLESPDRGLYVPVVVRDRDRFTTSE